MAWLKVEAAGNMLSVACSGLDIKSHYISCKKSSGSLTQKQNIDIKSFHK
jgi:hypothetical protein